VGTASGITGQVSPGEGLQVSFRETSSLCRYPPPTYSEHILKDGWPHPPGRPGTPVVQGRVGPLPGLFMATPSTPQRAGADATVIRGNEHWKAGARKQAVLATLMSSGIHLLIVLLVPPWTGHAESSGSSADFLRLEPLMVVEDAFGSEDPGAGVVPAFVPEPEPETASGDPQGAVDSPGSDLLGAAEHLRGRLLGEPTLAATVVEPEESTPSGVSEEAGGEGTEFRQVGSEASVPEWLTVSALELDRLSAVRPEMVVLAPSSWILVRNPVEIEQFMLTSREEGRLDPGFEGWVQVVIWIDERGSVEFSEVSRSSGDEEVDELALTLFRDVISFRPARDGGATVPVSVIFQLNFPFN
jgi:TonB family protein